MKSMKRKLVIGIILIVIGVGLLCWAGVGQIVAQIKLDGQYIAWRTVQDISLIGLAGLAPFAGGVFCIYMS